MKRNRQVNLVPLLITAALMVTVWLLTQLPL